MIHIEKLSKFYGSKDVLNGINISFESGKVYGIVGENGAGKTTFFKCLAGIEKYAGNITSDYDNLKNHIGFLTTAPFFFSKITGSEYIRLLCNARSVVVPDIKAKNVFDLPLNEYASLYSTGMKKKLALTALLLQKNDVYILDEPFNGVDIQSNIIITEIINKLKQSGKTVIIASHIFSTLTVTCDQINHLQKGKLLSSVLPSEFHTLEETMKNIVLGDRVDALMEGL